MANSNPIKWVEYSPGNRTYRIEIFADGDRYFAEWVCPECECRQRAITLHDTEEYGYLAVYLRLKGLIPPSTNAR